MHAHRLRDLTQRQGPQRQGAQGQKSVLPLQDGAGHREDGGKALLHVAQRPARLLQLLPQAWPGLGTMARAPVGIALLQAQARQDGGVQVGPPRPRLARPARAAPNHHVRNDGALGRRADAPARPRVEPTNLLTRGVHQMQRLCEPTREAHQVARGQGRKVLLHDGQGESGCLLGRIGLVIGSSIRVGQRRGTRRRRQPGRQRSCGAQLKRQTLREVARAHARWLQRLHPGQGQGPLTRLRRRLQCGQRLREIGQGLAQVTVLVERGGHRQTQQAFSRGQPQEPQLASQMLGQRHRAGQTRQALLARRGWLTGQIPALLLPFEEGVVADRLSQQLGVVGRGQLQQAHRLLLARRNRLLRAGSQALAGMQSK